MFSLSQLCEESRKEAGQTQTICWCFIDIFKTEIVTKQAEDVYQGCEAKVSGHIYASLIITPAASLLSSLSSELKHPLTWFTWFTENDLQLMSRRTQEMRRHKIEN